MKWLDCLRKPNFDITITVFQALILLAEKYRGDAKRKKKYDSIKTLCLSGVRNPKDEQLLEGLLSDRLLSNYRISSRKRDINNDPVRRYFESHLCHETLLITLDKLNIGLLERHLDSILERIHHLDWFDFLHSIETRRPLDERVAEYSEAVYALSEPDSYPSFQSTKLTEHSGGASPKSVSGRLSPEITLDPRKEKMSLLAQCMYAAEKVNEELESKEGILNIYSKKNSIYSDDKRGRSKKLDPRTGRTQRIYSSSFGIMTSLMPLQRDHILARQQPSTYVRPVDRWTYAEGSHEVPNQMFATQVTPFVSSISGVILIKLRVIAKLLRAHQFVYQFEPEQLKLFLQSHIAYMLYQAGGHSLDEYVRVFQLPEVQAEFKSIPGFASVTLDSLFKEGNSTAFDAALDKTIAYNQHILNTKKVQAELERQRSGALGTVSLCVAAKNRQFTVVNPGIFSYLPLFLLIYKLDEKRLSSEKDAGWKHQFTQLFGLFLLFTVAKVLGGAVVDTSPDKRSEPSVFQP